jgi:hypothetical protein
MKYPHKRRDPKRRLASFPKRRATRMHQVDSVMARAGPEEGIIDSGASAHITGIKTLLMDYKEVATTTVTVANKDILL